MNERIRALAKEAGIFYYRKSKLQVDMEKFAELVVRECIDVHTDDYGVDITGDILKRHFGIEIEE